MKKLYLLILLFVSTGIYAQNNFYAGLKEFYSTNPKPEGNNEEIESSEYNEMKRIEQIWAPRLFPHGGDESVAAAAMIDYAENYIPAMSSYNPEWTNLGPNGTIENNFGVGRIERICFDPQYNGTTNQTLYATSSFGGLWRTENDGGLWVPLTDYLPFTANADVAVSYQNSNNIFLGTGYADGRFEYTNEFNHINALHTFGVYRSTDYGSTWESISDGFIEEFLEEGGTTRRIIINPENENQLFAATTRGVFRCNNALATNPVWQKVLSFPEPALNDFRGLAFKPGNNDIVYASGLDVYKSNDGGSTFTPISINSLPADYEIHRINIATTQADADRLYAYVVGKAASESYNRLYIYLYHDSTGEWEEYIYTYGSSSTMYVVSKGRMAFAVSPVNANEFYLGHTVVKGTPYYTSFSVINQSSYNGNNCHADIHSLAFQPNVSEPDLFAGTDGGVGRKDLPNNNTQGWTMLYNGLSVNTIFGFDDSDYDHTKIIIGNMDCGTNKINDFENKDWKQIGLGGDGFGVRFDRSGLNRWFYKPNYWELPIRHNYTSNSYPSEDDFIPHVCPDYLLNEHSTGKLPFFNHPTTNVMYMGLQEIFRRLKPEPEGGDQWDDIWIEESNIYETGIAGWQLQIQGMEIAESNPDYMYIITVGVQNDLFDEWKLAARILKTITGGTNGVCDIVKFTLVDYPGYDPDPQTFFPIVSNLTIDPNNENRFWITYTGFVDEYKVYRTDDGGETWENEDPNGTLANIPVNDIIYQYGSNDRLFIGTDAGVYVKNGSNADWEKFGDIPNVRVNRLKINYCANKLRAGTFGRGIWETDIPEACNSFTKTIEEDLIWETNWSLKGDLIIETGYTLTIKERINMPPNSKIIVKRSAKLIIDGGHITNGCGNLWKGIEVWGTSTASQNTTDQGWVQVINGGTIANAEIGIRAVKIEESGGEGTVNYLFTGGIVQCSDANFANNKIAVQFYKYPSGTQSYLSLSNFSDCDFVTDDMYIGDGQPLYFVKMNEINGINFSNCTFSNSSSQQNYGSGIYSYHCDFDVKGICVSGTNPCTEWDYGLFENLQYGIYAMEAGTERNVEINYIEFNNNYRGVYVSGMTNAVVTNSNFSINSHFSPVGGYGLYLSNSTGYKIEENNFYHEGEDATGVGLIVHNSGIYPNEIYRNGFTNLQQGISCQEQNRDNEDQGLQLLCNDFDDCTADILVPRPREGGWGIAPSQGIDGHEMTDMAGNLFYIPGPPDGDFDDIDNEGAFFDYYYPSNPAPGFEDTKPEDYTENSVEIHANYITSGEWSFEEGCPPSEEGGVEPDRDEMRSSMASAEQEIAATEATLAQLIDGGDTEALNTEVETSIPPETVEVYNELMNESPWVSETVVESSIEKENVLPNVMIRDVMVANPHTAKSDVLMEKLDERLIPLPEYMKAQILQGRSLTSLKDELESQLAGYKLKKARAFNGLVRSFINESATWQEASDSLLALYQQDNDLQSKYRLMMLHLERGEYLQGETILYNIVTQYGLEGDNLTAHQNMESYYSLVREIIEAGKSLMEADSLQILELQTIEIADAGIASTWARDVLVALGEMTYEEPIQMPDLMKSAKAIEEYEKLLSTEPPQMLEVYPNPSKGYVIMEYKLETEQEGTIEITDINGKPVHSFNFTEIRDQVTVLTQDWKPGVYIASLKINGKLVESTKFTLID